MKRGLLIDLDGVVYQGDIVIPGALETITWIRRTGLPHLFLTNTSSRPRNSIVAKLARMDIVVDSREILTPVIAVRNWIAAEGLTRVAYFVAEGTRKDFDLDTEAQYDRSVSVEAVVIGDLGDAWDFKTLNQAFRLLMENPEAPLLALGMTRYWRAEDGLRLDVAPFVVALEHATGRKALVMGKPSEDFFEQAAEACDLKAEELVMVGDDIRGDVEGAQRAGIAGILVRTGKFTEHDLDTEIKPEAVLESLADLPVWWEGE
jgi:HAD superfamily hydrolase (TIGR01458 family)